MAFRHCRQRIDISPNDDEHAWMLLKYMHLHQWNPWSDLKSRNCDETNIQGRCLSKPSVMPFPKRFRSDSPLPKHQMSDLRRPTSDVRLALPHPLPFTHSSLPLFVSSPLHLIHFPLVSALRSSARFTAHSKTLLQSSSNPPHFFSVPSLAFVFIPLHRLLPSLHISIQVVISAFPPPVIQQPGLFIHHTILIEQESQSHTLNDSFVQEDIATFSSSCPRLMPPSRFASWCPA